MKVHLWQASLAMQCDMLMMSVIVYQVQLDLGYIYWYQTHDDDVTTQKYTQKSKWVYCEGVSLKYDDSICIRKSKWVYCTVVCHWECGVYDMLSWCVVYVCIEGIVIHLLNVIWWYNTQVSIFETACHHTPKYAKVQRNIREHKKYLLLW